MHELSLCESLVRSLEAQAEDQKFKKISTIWLEVGALAAVEPAAMEYTFPIVARGTVAEHARLVLLPVDGAKIRVTQLEVD